MKYLFNTVNNKECARGQRTVIWLKRSQPCLHHLHMLSTTFSWQPLSSFSLWIILLLSDSRCFLLFGQAIFFLCHLWLRLALCNGRFFVIWAARLGGTFVSAFGHGFCLGVSSATSWFESSTTAWQWHFRETERLWFCVYFLGSQAANELSHPRA